MSNLTEYFIFEGLNKCLFVKSTSKKWFCIALQVKLALYKAGHEVAYVTFDGVESTNENWFSAARLTGSSWTDMTHKSTYNVFSVKG